MWEFIQNILKFYPFSLTDTLALIPTLILFFQYLVKGQWEKLRDQAKVLGLQMYEKIATDKEKRDAVLQKIEEAVPALMKPLIKDGELGKMIDLVYTTQIKPQAKVEELVKGEPVKELNTIESLAADMLGGVIGRIADEVEINLVRRE